MGVGDGLYMYDVVKTFTFPISSDEFLLNIHRQPWVIPPRGIRGTRSPTLEDVETRSIWNAWSLTAIL